MTFSSVLQGSFSGLCQGLPDVRYTIFYPQMCEKMDPTMKVQSTPSRSSKTRDKLSLDTLSLFTLPRFMAKIRSWRWEMGGSLEPEALAISTSSFPGEGYLLGAPQAYLQKLRQSSERPHQFIRQMGQVHQVKKY